MRTSLPCKRAEGKVGPVLHACPLVFFSLQDSAVRSLWKILPRFCPYSLCFALRTCGVSRCCDCGFRDADSVRGRPQRARTFHGTWLFLCFTRDDVLVALSWLIFSFPLLPFVHVFFYFVGCFRCRWRYCCWRYIVFVVVVDDDDDDDDVGCVAAIVVSIQVVAQGERSLSLSLGSKGLHLTLADRATKEYLWEHLRKMREQAREQAKASRITRAASIDMISNSQEFKRCVCGT